MLVFVLCIFDIVSTGAFETAGRVMPGQPHHVPVNNTKVLAAAQFAVVEFNRASAERFYYKIVNITSARVQVVAGINYILDVQLGRTMYKKSLTTVREPCVYQSGPNASSRFKELQCHFIVTEVPWEDSRVLTRTKCHLQNGYAGLAK